MQCCDNDPDNFIKVCVEIRMLQLLREVIPLNLASWESLF